MLAPVDAHSILSSPNNRASRAQGGPLIPNTDLQQVGSSENCLHSSIFSHHLRPFHQLAARNQEM